MVKIFKNYQVNGEMVIVTNAENVEQFLTDLLLVIPKTLKEREGDVEFTLVEIVDGALAIMDKFQGRKLDSKISVETVIKYGCTKPEDCTLIANSEKYYEENRLTNEFVHESCDVIHAAIEKAANEKK